jgi:hypothetical protein
VTQIGSFSFFLFFGQLSSFLKLSFLCWANNVEGQILFDPLANSLMDSMVFENHFGSTAKNMIYLSHKKFFCVEALRYDQNFVCDSVQRHLHGVGYDSFCTENFIRFFLHICCKCVKVIGLNAQ